MKPIDWNDPANAGLLGSNGDAEVARVLGCSPDAVRLARYARGIPALYQAGRPESIDWAKARPRLGEAPDREVARAMRVSLNAVRAARARRGIPAFNP